MNRTAPGAAEALGSAFLSILREGPASFSDWEAAALELGRRCVAEAMAAALEARDRELRSSLPRGARVHSLRRRTLATPTGDVTFSRTLCLDADGLALCPLDDALDLPRGDRVSPAAREFLVAAGIEVPYARAARLLALSGGSQVSATCVMGSVRAAGAEVAARQREAARALYEDGVHPASEMLAAPELFVEGDGTFVRMRDGSRAEVRAMVAYAGKEGPAGRRSRVSPVRLGCVGEAPGDFWRQAVAHLGSRFDLSSVGRCHLGADGEPAYLDAGPGALRFREVDSWVDPFHVDRAVLSCFPKGSPRRAEALASLRGSGAEACAGLIDAAAAAGECLSGAGDVASYLRRHASQIGGGPSMGTMEAEQQHMYKVRMGSFPCAWSREGADAVARLRSWAASGMALPRRTREGSLSAARAEARDSRLGSSPRMVAARAVKSEGRGWEYPLAASLRGAASDVRFRAGV